MLQVRSPLINKAVSQWHSVVQSLRRCYPHIEPAVIEDAVSDALRIFYEYFERGNLRTEGTSAFLHTTARRCLMHSLKRESRYVIEEDPRVVEDSSHAFEHRDLLEKVFAALRDSDVEIIDLYALAGYQFEEIANLRKQSIKTTHRQYERAISRAGNALRKLVRPSQENLNTSVAISTDTPSYFRLSPR